MGFESQFLQFSTQVVTVAPLSTHNSYGAPTFGTSTSYRAYVEPGTRVILNQQGVQEVATATVYVLSSSAVVGPQDKITLPDARTPKLLRVDTLNDDKGQHHLELLVQ